MTNKCNYSICLVFNMVVLPENIVGSVDGNVRQAGAGNVRWVG